MRVAIVLLIVGAFVGGAHGAVMAYNGFTPFGEGALFFWGTGIPIYMFCGVLSAIVWGLTE